MSGPVTKERKRARELFNLHFTAASKKPWDLEETAAELVGLLDSISEPEVADSEPTANALASMVQKLAASRKGHGVASTLIFAMTRVCEALAGGPTDKVCKAMLDASRRAEVFSHGERLRLALLAFMVDPQPFCELVARTEFGDDDPAAIYIRYLLNHRSSRRFDVAFRAFLRCMDRAEERALYKKLDDFDGALEALPQLAQHVAEDNRSAHWALADLCGRLGSESEPLLIYLVTDGHRHALPEAIAALGKVGSADAFAALDLARDNAWDPVHVTAATEARVAIEDSGPRRPSTGVVATRVRERLAGKSCATGWTFAERQLLDLFVVADGGSGDDDAERALQVLWEDPAAKAAAFVDVVDRRISQLIAPEGADLDPTDGISALFALRVPPLSTRPDVLDLLVETLGVDAHSNKLRFNARATLTAITASDSGLALTPDQRISVLNVQELDVWNRSRYELLVLGLPERLWAWRAAFQERHEPHEPAELEQRIIASLPPEPRTHEALAVLYADAEETAVRGLLRGIAPSMRPEYLPTWVAAAADKTPSTRKLLCEAMGRLGHIAAEPWLQRALADADGGVQLAAIEALGGVGTRLSIAELMELSAGQGAVASAARAAAEAIAGRYPAEDYAAPGSLSLAGEEGWQGALSLLGADEGSVSLYGAMVSASEAGPVTASAGPSKPASRAEESAAELDRWAHISAPPRRVPLALRWAYLWLGTRHQGFVGWAAWAVWALAIPWLFDDVDALSRVSAWTGFGFFSLVAWLLGTDIWSGTPRELELLRLGLPARAEQASREKKTSGTGDGEKISWVYRFRFYGEGGGLHEHELEAGTDRAALSDDEREAILYLPDDRGAPSEVVICDNLLHVYATDGGRLRVRRGAMLASLIPFAMVVWALTVPWVL